MSSTAPNSKPDPPSPSTCTQLQSLERRMSALCIRIATDRADAREKLTLVPGTWTRDSAYTSQLDQFQISIERAWIGLRGANMKKKELYVGIMEEMYEDMITAWRAERKV